MKILICDTNNLVARGTFALPNAVDPDGRHTGGLYLTVSMIRKFLAAEPHDAIMMALDHGVPAFRKEVCPEYKAQRAEQRSAEEEKMHQAYREQVSRCAELFSPFGLVTARAKGWEGDDVVAALCLERFPEHVCTIMSSDRDFTQLVDGVRISLWDVGKDRWVDPDPLFCLKRCMDPKTSDNLDGVPGIGPKKAEKLVESWMTSRVGETEPVEPRRIPSMFVDWCAERAKVEDPLGKLARKVFAEQQKLRANWKCTHLPRMAAVCNSELKFRRTVPDKQAAKDALKVLGLRPFAEDFSALWPPFAGLQCPV